MNTPVSFELAKLLKEKGYDLSTEGFYPKPKCKLFAIDEHGRYYPIVNKTQSSFDGKALVYFHGKAVVLKEENYYNAPTIAEVVMWLYEKHGIWIEVRKSYLSDFVPVIKGPRVELDTCKSPTEAYEAGIEYTLNNLI
jgi:hypothetical protein